MRYRFALLFALLLMPLLCQGYTDNYPYQSVCPTGYKPDGVTESESIPGGIIFRGAGEDVWLASYTDAKGVFRARDYWKDKWSFAQCNCTSYAAFVMNVYFPSFTDEYNFNNGYRGAHWGNGGHWDDAARSVGISVDRNPIPGDIAYWNTLGGYGHVAVVEKVRFDANGNKVGVDWTQYNNPDAYEWSAQTNRPITEPDGYIHILAYEEGVSSLHYMDCYEMHCEGQTPEEWSRILQSVSGYRCKNCNGEHQAVADAFYDGPVFGGSDPGGGSVTPPPSSEPRNDLVPHVNAYRTTGDKRQVTADCGTCSTEPVTEGEVLRVEQIMDSKYSDASQWFREKFNSIYTTVWYKIVTADKTTVAVPWTELFTRKFDPGKLEEGESYGESTTFTVPVGYPNHYLVLASCADPTDRVLERNELPERMDPARNPDECGTNNTTRKEWLWINPRPKVFDYVVKNAGMINAPPYLWIHETFRPWYEAVNQGSDTQEDRIAVSVKRIDPTNALIPIQKRYIEPGTLTPNTTYLDQLGMNVIVYGPPGMHQLQFCINAEGKPESNTGNNCLSKPFEVRDPDRSYPCGLITPETWIQWSTQSYGAPLDFFDGNRLVISPLCRKTHPDSIDMTFGKNDDANVIVYKTVHIQNGKTGAKTSFTVNCKKVDLGAYCEGGAWLNISGIHVDTSSATQPTTILVYTCHKREDGTWACGCKDANCTTSGWQRQLAAFVR